MSDYMDSKMLIWIVGMIFFAGGGWFSIDSLADRVTRLEDGQDKVHHSMTIMMKNQARMCQALEVDCE
jgi:hypothetical protein